MSDLTIKDVKELGKFLSHYHNAKSPILDLGSHFSKVFTDVCKVLEEHPDILTMPSDSGIFVLNSTDPEIYEEVVYIKRQVLLGNFDRITLMHRQTCIKMCQYVFEYLSKNSTNTQESETYNRRMRERISALLIPLENCVNDETKEAIQWTLRKIQGSEGI